MKIKRHHQGSWDAIAPDIPDGLDDGETNSQEYSTTDLESETMKINVIPFLSYLFDMRSIPSRFSRKDSTPYT